MNTQLVEIHPREVKFLFEVKKQSSCVVHLANVTDQYIAFKVKTTSPKKYCVRPNVGVIGPNAKCDFTVTMQAQKNAPSDLSCKDKFLIQSTVVPFGTKEDDITPGMFARDGEKHIEETKLRVILTSAPNSPAKQQNPEVWKQETPNEFLTPKEPKSPIVLPVIVDVKELSHETPEPPIPVILNQEKSYNDLKDSPVLLPIGISKQESSLESPTTINKSLGDTEYFPPPDMVVKKEYTKINTQNVEIPALLKVSDSIKSVPATMELEKELDQINELKTKISAMDMKLVEAERIIVKLKDEKSMIEHTILKLKEEKSSTLNEMQILKQELAMARKTSGGRKVRAGFPPLFVCMVAMISLIMGLFFRY